MNEVGKCEKRKEGLIGKAVDVALEVWNLLSYSATQFLCNASEVT